MKVPVLIVAWKRPDKVKSVISALRAVKPEEIFIACDGPRTKNEKDFKLVLETRRILIEEIDWDCSIKKRFQNFRRERKSATKIQKFYFKAKKKIIQRRS